MRCPYYTEHKPGEEVRAYCRHKHSPAPLELIVHVMGGAPLLTCQGDLSRCQVPPEKRLDLS